MDKEDCENYYQEFKREFCEQYPEEYWNYWSKLPQKQDEDFALDVPF